MDFLAALAQQPAQAPPRELDSAAGERLGAETLRGEDLDACKHFEVRPSTCGVKHRARTPLWARSKSAREAACSSASGKSA